MAHAVQALFMLLCKHKTHPPPHTVTNTHTLTQGAVQECAPSPVQECAPSPPRLSGSPQNSTVLLCLQGICIKSEDSARAVGNAIKSLPQLHTVRVDGTSLHPAFYEALAPQSTAATQTADKRDEALDVPGLRKLHYGFMNSDGPPLKAISTIRSLHSLASALAACSKKCLSLRGCLQEHMH